MANAPYDYDYIDYYDDDVHPDVKKIERRIEHAADHMQGLIEELTGAHKLDLNAIYFHLGEVCAVLGNDESFGPLTISRNEKILQFAGV